MIVHTVSSFNTPAIKAVAAFDLDGTVVPYTGTLFWRFLWSRHPETIARGPYNIPNASLWFRNQKAIRKRLEALRETPDFQALVREYSATALERHIYPRTAEEIAWRLANLQTIVVITGGFDAFAEPIYRRLHADRVHSNPRFVRLEVHGDNKPEVLRTHYFNEAAGFTPQAVYTDSHSDRPMLEAFSWAEVHVMSHPLWKCQFGNQKLLWRREPTWSLLEPNSSNRNFPEVVRDYAACVIRGQPHLESTLAFYEDWNEQLGEIGELSPIGRLNASALAGLYLKENDITRQAILHRVGMEFERRCADNYAELITKAPHSTTPLKEVFL